MAVLHCKQSFARQSRKNCKIWPGAKALDEMVDFIRRELGLPKQNIVPVPAYFCHAFSLPLRVSSAAARTDR